MKGPIALPHWPRVMRREKAAAYLDLGPSTFDREVAAGRLPQPIPLAGILKGWVRDDLDAWIDNRRDAHLAPPNPWDAAP